MLERDLARVAELDRFTDLRELGELREENREIRQALKDIETNRAAFVRARSKTTALEARIGKLYAAPDPLADDRLQLLTIHKAKGLECDHAMIMACDRNQFSSTMYAKCKLYVAISRAKRSLTLVVPSVNTSPLFSI